MYKSHTTDQRWTTLCTYACVVDAFKNSQGIYCSSRKFSSDKIFLFNFVHLINVVKERNEIEFLKKYFCSKQYALQNKHSLSLI